MELEVDVEVVDVVELAVVPPAPPVLVVEATLEAPPLPPKPEGSPSPLLQANKAVESANTKPMRTDVMKLPRC